MRHILFLFSFALLVVACTQAGTSDNYYETENGQNTSSLPPTSTSSMPSIDATVWDGDLLTGTHVVMLHTSLGDISMELYADEAPMTVTNFVGLARTGYYDGLTFHRVIPGFMIQGGDPSGNGTGGKSLFGETFEDEIDPSAELYQIGYQAGVVAMANRGPDTNGSQFFIMEADYPLSPDYTIFGKVTDGQDVISKIANVQRNQQNDMPLSPVTFTVEIKE